MRHIHHFKPVVAHGLEWRDAFAHAVNENFSTAPRDRAEPGLLEIAEDLLERLVEHFPEMDELARAETVDVDLREFAFDVVQQVKVPLLGQLRMMSALHQDLRAAQRNRLLDLL